MRRLVRGMFVVALAAGLAAGLTGGKAHGRTLAVFTVDDTNDRVDATPGDGLCRTGRGTCSLRAAVMEANALQQRIGGSLPENRDVVIRLAAATYVLDRGPGAVDSDVDGDLLLVTRAGSAADHEGVVTISGQGAAVTTIRSTVRDRVLTTRARTVLENLTITGGRAGAAGSLDRAGGGILAGNQLTLRGVAVTGNTALLGGGISSQGATVVDSSRVSDNTGEGIAQGGSSLNVRGSTIAGNEGPGVFYEPLPSPDPNVLSISTSVVADNTLHPSYRYGGGVVVCCGDPTVRVDARIEDTTIRGNVGSDGGGVSASGPVIRVTVDRSVVAGNSGISGGGVFTAQSTVRLENVTLSGNAGEQAGGLYAGGPVSLTAVTFLGDSGSTASDVLHYAGSGAGSAEATILGDASACPRGSGVNSLGFNVSRDASCGFHLGSDLNGVDPRLGPLADNGGATQTHALLDGSPALDHYTGPTCPGTDQRYRRRPAGAACDSGAYERNGALILPTITGLPPPRYGVIGGVFTLFPLPTGTARTTSLQGGDYRPCTPGARIRMGAFAGFFKPSDGRVATRGSLVFRRDANRQVRLGNLLVLLDGQAGRVVALVAPTRGPLVLFDVDSVRYLKSQASGRLHLSGAAARLLDRLLGVQGFRAGMACGRLHLILGIAPNPGHLPPVSPSPPPVPPATTTTTTTPATQTFTLGAIVDPGDGGSISSDPGGISCPSDCSETYAAGTSVKLKAHPADGFEFKEWDGSCGGSNESCTVTIDQNRSVTARFKQKQSSKPQCSDGKDNDGDNAIDLQDPQCNGPNDDDESK